jgi:hypothetical protein
MANDYWTSRMTQYFVADEERRFILRTRGSARDKEVDTWMRVGRTYLRLTENGKAVVFELQMENRVGELRVGIVTGQHEDA